MSTADSTEEGLAGGPPHLVLAGEWDDILDYRSDALPVYEALTDADLLRFEKVGHYAFSDLCDFLPGFQPECEEEGWADIETVQEQTKAAVTWWLRQRWDEDPRWSLLDLERWVGAQPGMHWGPAEDQSKR